MNILSLLSLVFKGPVAAGTNVLGSVMNNERVKRSVGLTIFITIIYLLITHAKDTIAEYRLLEESRNNTAVTQAVSERDRALATVKQLEHENMVKEQQAVAQRKINQSTARANQELQADLSKARLDLDKEKDRLDRMQNVIVRDALRNHNRNIERTNRFVREQMLAYERITSGEYHEN